MNEPVLDLNASATLFVGTNLDKADAGLPAINRVHWYFSLARNARLACEHLGPLTSGSFLVQQGRRFDVSSLLRPADEQVPQAST